MKPLMNFPQSVAGDVCVNFRGADVRVPQQFLDHAQVRAVLQQMRGETVSQHVRRHVAGHPCTPHAPFDAQPHRDLCEWRSPFGQENIRR